MKAISTIFRREIGAYLRSPIGWIVASVLLLIDGFMFQQVLSKELLSADVLTMFFLYTSSVASIGGVILSIRLLAEERQTHSIVLLNTSPITDTEIIIGKFAAAFVFLSGMILLSIYMPLLIKVNGKISLAQIAVGYLGLLLFGSVSLAVGIFASALTRHQLVAAVVAAALLGMLCLLFPFSTRIDAPLRDVVGQLDPWWGHFQASFMKGIFNLKDVVFDVAMTYFFLLLAVKTLEAKRWQ